MLERKAIQLINTLAYAITLARKPEQHAGQCLRDFRKDHPEITTEQIQAALNQALEKSGWADEIAVIGRHTEDDMKRFLSAVKKQLDTRP